MFYAGALHTAKIEEPFKAHKLLNCSHPVRLLPAPIYSIAAISVALIP